VGVSHLPLGRVPLGQLLLDRPEVRLHRVQPGRVLRGVQDEHAVMVREAHNRLVVVDGRIVHEQHDGPPVIALLGAQVLEQLVHEVLEHGGVDAALHHQVREHVVLGDGRDQRHREALDRLLRRLPLQLPGQHAARPKGLLLFGPEVVLESLALGLPELGEGII
jgi:hypothetical protein